MRIERVCSDLRRSAQLALLAGSVFFLAIGGCALVDGNRPEINQPRDVVVGDEMLVPPGPARILGIYHSLGRMVIVASIRGTALGAGDEEERGGINKADGIRIYRKPRGAHDDDYQLLTPETIRPVGIDEVFDNLQELNVVWPVARREDAEERFGEIMPVKRENIFCLFVDETVTPGREYTYRLVAVSNGAPERESVPSFTDVAVPPDIEFFVTSARSLTDTINVMIFKHEYNLDDEEKGPVTYLLAFQNIKQGDAVGGASSELFISDYWTRQRIPGRAVGDMFTGYYFIGKETVTPVSGRVVPWFGLDPPPSTKLDRIISTPFGRTQEGVDYHIRPMRPMISWMFIDEQGRIVGRFLQMFPRDSRIPY